MVSPWEYRRQNVQKDRKCEGTEINFAKVGFKEIK